MFKGLVVMSFSEETVLEQQTALQNLHGISAQAQVYVASCLTVF